MNVLAETILALTNGSMEKPHWKRDDNRECIDVLVADEQVMCSIPKFENDEDLANAICVAGKLLEHLRTENKRLAALVIDAKNCSCDVQKERDYLKELQMDSTAMLHKIAYTSSRQAVKIDELEKAIEKIQNEK